MPREEIEQVRPVKFKKNGRDLRPEPSDVFDKMRGRLDDGGRLDQFYARSMVWSPADIKLGLVRKLGSPFADNLLGAPLNFLVANAQVIQTRWESPACDVDIVLNVTMAGSGDLAGSAAHLFMVRHGAAYSKD